MEDTSCVDKMFVILTLFSLGFIANAEVLTPPYFNLAFQRDIKATSTCGQGVSFEERYCKLTGADPGAFEEQYGEVIQGQLCDVCVSDETAREYSRDRPKAGDPGYWNWRVHNPENAVDGSEKWWQSPPLSRGLKYNSVNLTIDLGQEFHVAYVFIKMANSPRPGVFALDRSVDGGQTWKPWQYFADTFNDCYHFFGNEQQFATSISTDDTVICTTEYSSVVPLEHGEIAISLVNGRPSANNFSNSGILQEWTKATNVRLRLVRTKTLLGHLMALNVDQDPTVTRRYFYSIKDISIGGRCVCNGHADICNKYDPTGRDPRKLVCSCSHNTCGDQCERCCPGFVQKPWQPATVGSANECEPCQCYGHTQECVYDEEVARNRQSIDIHGRYDGGGRCLNCRDNTEGINCEKCIFGYFRPARTPLDSRDVCQPCNCDLAFTTGDCDDDTGRCICRPEYSGPNCESCNTGYYGWPQCQPCDCHAQGTLNGVCEARGGQCPCKPQYEGQFCDSCAYGYYDFPNCRRCQCGGVGVLDGSCDTVSGQCTCANNYAGRDCDQCSAGHYSYPACNLCDCDPNGCTADICDPSNGGCVCKENFAGQRCDQCASGYFRYPFCVQCDCLVPGSRDTYCDANGQCNCKQNFAGPKCGRCAPGYYQYPNCLPCNCDTYGSRGQSCSQQTGACECNPTFTGLTCDQCKPNYYNYPNCEECNCNPSGARAIAGSPLGGCGIINQGVLCECKERVTGRICDMCKHGFYNLDRNNPYGCDDCDCDRAGTTGAQNQCDLHNGQCVCKTFTEGRRCSKCIDGMYSLKEFNHFGCKDCQCDVGGSVDGNCDPNTGECTCRPRVGGIRCNEPISTHYFPSLLHHQYEMEDGRTVRGGPVRYGYDQNLYPNFSWRGYAILSRVQDEVVIDVDVTRSTLFHIVYNFVNRNPDTVTAEVTVKSDTPGNVPQTSTVYFPASGGKPMLVTAGTTVYLTSGRWKISLKSPRTLFVDYMALVPREYYEASVLQQPVNAVCRLPGSDEPCRHYVYVDVSTFQAARGEQGTIRIGNQQDRTQLFPDQDITDKLESSGMAYLDSAQSEVSFSLPVLNPGRYYLVVLYHSTVEGRSQDVNIELASQGIRENGRLRLAGCPYTSLCRQVVVDGNGDAKVFDIRDNFASIMLDGGSDIDLAVDSIVAIPANQWDLELIQPRLKCIQINHRCVESNYQHPTGAVHVEFESGPNAVRVADDIPPNILDTGVKVIKLNGAQPTVNVKASVDNYGPHAFVVHYFQPYDIGFDVQVDVLVGPQINKGKFRADYCPSVSGCRSAVSFDDESLNGQVLDLSDLDIILAFNNSVGKPIWLDYIMVVPVVQSFDDSVLDIRPVDKSAEFISQCASNNFFIDSNSQGFCRDGVFSLTADYNNGALSCDCDISGSLDFMCQQFGGQCPCKVNVIGRHCSRCRTGYYGFPNCRPCNCPSGLCDDRSGQCMCPPRVTGDNCDTCERQTFGFDPLIGCEECNCDPDGVKRRNQECDVTNGQCECRNNVMGRRCDECQFGFHGFPRCRQCTCEVAGTTPRICDPLDARCICKDNVEGPNCDRCVLGTYYLEERNTKGCTQCFCFGTTSQCQASTLRRKQINEMLGWGMTNLQIPLLRTTGYTVETYIDKDNVRNPGGLHYWVAPLEYIGNQITSYGGKLTYTIKFGIDQAEDSDSLIRADVKIEGNNMTLTYINAQQPEPGRELKMEVVLLENNFVHEVNGAGVSRQQFMLTLANIDSLQIRASYYEKISYSSLGDVTLEAAATDGRGDIASNVEQCFCPPNYMGTSCEKCAPGYYRSGSGRYLGDCVPCQCHGRSDVCDPETGACTSCRDSFEGPQCLKCMRGHYEDPYTGRCEPCACPGSYGNNFASTCQVSQTGIVMSCVCDPGYTGQNCGICDNGYWGEPRERGGSCQLCQCNNNIQIRDRLSCDVNTGACLRCINNSTGQRCERCLDWYWGDAINAKNCKLCTCDQLGSELCDSVSGACLCKPNVVGPDCDRCAPNTYGFTSGRGCQPCDCAQAAYSAQCDLQTGQCQCPPGVTGLRCDQCERGYYGYSVTGCQKCECESDGAVTCDTVTGTCQCLPGVTGPKCDMCLNRWVLIPDQGCLECDQCVHILLDDLNDMDFNINDMIGDLENVHVGATARKRLAAINQTVYDLRPQVDNLVSNPTDSTVLDPLKQDMMQVKEQAKQVRNRAHHTAREAEVVEMDAGDVRVGAIDVQGLVTMAVDNANEAVTYAENVLQDILSNIRDNNVTLLLQEAAKILEEIQKRDFSDNNRRAEDELTDAINALRRARDLHNRAVEQANRTMTLGRQVVDISDKLKDLQNNSRHSFDNSKAAIDMNKRTQQQVDDLNRKLGEIRDYANDATMMEDMANDLLNQASGFLVDARAAFGDVEVESSQLDTAMGKMRGFVDSRKRDNGELTPLVQRAMDHANSLSREAERLDSLLSDTRLSSIDALNASRAYQAIVDAIENAMMAAEEAIDAGNQAKNLSNGLAENARLSRLRSEGLSTDAQDVKRRVQTQLRTRLGQAKFDTETIEDLNIQTRDRLNRLNASLDMLPAGGYGQEAQDAANKAMDAQQKAEDAKNKIQTIKQQLPDDLNKVREIPEMINEANRDIMRAQTQVDNVIDLEPKMNELIDQLEAKSTQITQLGEDLTKQIRDLRVNILLARGDAGRIEIGEAFDAETVLQVRNPPDLKDAGGYSKISMYFRKTDNEPNAFLAYIGPDAESRRQFNDYLALEMVDGYVVFRYDLGEGPVEIRSQRTYNDDLWHEVIAERTGQTGTLTVRTQGEVNDVQVGSSPGTKSVFDLTMDTVKFFIGGVPARAGLTDQVNTQRFVGAIEDVKFDGTPVGMWDFVYGENNNKGVQPRPSDNLPLDTPDGFRFSGDGYIVLDKLRFRPERASRVEFDFRTYSDNGLLFLMGKEDTWGDFFSIELRNGKLLFQYDLGSGIAKLLSADPYNDGQWHHVSANRVRKDGLLKVDTQTVDSAASRGTQTDLDIGANVYIGGYKGIHHFPDVTNQSYEGCIKNVQLGSTQRNIKEHKLALNVVPGCSEIARIVSFDGVNSFISMDPVNINSDFQMTMKVKSTADSGVLFYATDDSLEQENAMSVVMKNGQIVLVAAPETTPTVLTTEGSNYNDGGWHFITVTKRGREIQLDIDDTSMVNTKYQDGKKRITTTSPLYFGGIPPGFQFNGNNVNDIQNSLAGCIGDVTINGEFINFAIAAPTNMNGVSLSSCPIPDPTPIPTLPPSVATYPPPRPTDDTTYTCALPLRPAIAGPEAGGSGTRFGASPDSRWQYDGVNEVIVDESHFVIEMKTTSGNGVIFYTSDDKHQDFMAVYMKDGIVHYDFNCGSGAARISSLNTYNDDQWHTIAFFRKGRSGRLEIDGTEEQSGDGTGGSRSLNILPPFFVGGLSNDVAGAAADNLQDVVGGFGGCLRNPTLNGKEFGSPSLDYSTEPCSAPVEDGTFFAEGGGNVKLVENFVVGLDKNIYLEVRPRSLSGVLASVFSPTEKEYLVVQMLNGDVLFNVYNGVGEDGEGEELHTTFVPSPRNSLCDGQWHTIRAEKNKNVVRVRVDGVYSKVGIGVEGVSETNTNHPLYIGGVPTRHSGIRTTEDFVGCIRNVKIGQGDTEQSDVSYNLSSGTPDGSVNLNSCPLN